MFVPRLTPYSFFLEDTSWVVERVLTEDEQRAMELLRTYRHKHFSLTFVRQGSKPD